MPKDKGREWDYVTVIDDGGDKGVAYTSMKCLFCDKTFHGGPNRIRAQPCCDKRHVYKRLLKIWL